MSFFNRRKRPRNVVPISDTAPWILYGAQRTQKNDNPLRPPCHQINSKLYIFLGDITELQVDSIVNAANNTLLGGGGVDGAIHAAAGPALREECSKLGGCSTGDAKITKGHNLPSKHIIHTVGPRGKKPEVLKSCYSKCYELMLENQLKSIAFPCISTGIYGYPNQAAAEVAIETTREFLEVNYEQVDAVIFCLFTNKDIEAYHKLLPVYFPLCSKEESSNCGNRGAEKEETETVVKNSADEVDKSADVGVEVKDRKDGSKDTENAAKCSDTVSDKDNEKQSDSIKHQNHEEMSQEQSEAMSQEQSEAMSQEQSSKVVDEKEENMSFQEEG